MIVNDDDHGKECKVCPLKLEEKDTLIVYALVLEK
jgi:hypothetical protein